jgi:hypothetical protein
VGLTDPESDPLDTSIRGVFNLVHEHVAAIQNFIGKFPLEQREDVTNAIILSIKCAPSKG